MPSVANHSLQAKNQRNMAKRRILILINCLIFLSACTSVSQLQYADNQPAMDVREFFNGDLSAHGIVKNRSGTIIRYFNANIIASWNNDVGTLDETFYFDDGEIQKRIWTLKNDSNGQLVGSANDVIGSSALSVSGNSLFMNYVLRVPYDDTTIDISIDDRMYRLSENLVINESTMSKWGFNVGQIVLVIEKQG